VSAAMTEWIIVMDLLFGGAPPVGDDVPQLGLS
jgi:hypothetical protein